MHFILTDISRFVYLNKQPRRIYIYFFFSSRSIASHEIIVCYSFHCIKSVQLFEELAYSLNAAEEIRSAYKVRAERRERAPLVTQRFLYRRIRERNKYAR